MTILATDRMAALSDIPPEKDCGARRPAVLQRCFGEPRTTQTSSVRPTQMLCASPSSQGGLEIRNDSR